jgi:CBS-domain-containing membrane protein
MKYFQKFYGQERSRTKATSISDIVFAYVGGFMAICLIGYLTKSFDTLLVMGSFGASCVLIFAFPKSPFSQPRNIVLGHFFSTLTGLLFLHFIGDIWWSMALALATAIAIMLITKTVHPPAGSNPLIVFLLHANFEYLIFPSFVGSIILVIVALLYINLHPKKEYPQYWY